MNPQLKKGVLELCVLSQLTKEDKYGYELTDAISREMSIAAGTLYMILKRLKEAGYVETYLQESASGPARKTALSQLRPGCRERLICRP